MRRTSGLAGIIGLIFIVFGLLEFIFTSGALPTFFTLANLLAGMIAIIVWATSLSRGKLSAIAGHRATRHGAHAALYTVLVILLLAAFNFLATRYHRVFDLTAEKVYSLSPQSVEIVHQLKKPLKFYGFVKGGDSVAATALYEEYGYNSPLVKFELIDPLKDPALAQKFNITAYDTTRIEYGDPNDPKTQGLNVTDMSEQAITNGILKLMSSGTRYVYFTDGHGESDPGGGDQDQQSFAAAQNALEGENYEVRKILLASGAKVPDDCSALIIAGPTRPFLPNEIDQINAYLRQGGHLLALLRPLPPQMQDGELELTKFLDEWGVNIGDDIVVDMVLRLFAGPQAGITPIVNSYGQSPITASFSTDKQTVFPMSRSVEPSDKPVAGLVVTPLAMTSDSSWADSKNLAAIFDGQPPKFDAAVDRKGPITIADSIEANLGQLGWGKGTARIVAVGSTEFANAHFIKDFYNLDFFVNSVDWLVGASNQITVRPRVLRASRFALSAAQLDVVFALSVLLLPEMLLILGVAVWWERRS